MCVNSGAAWLIPAAVCQIGSPWVELPLRTASSKVGAGVTQITVTHRLGLPPPPAVIIALGSCSNKCQNFG
jgi:hypothetical protein